MAARAALEVIAVRVNIPALIPSGCRCGDRDVVIYPTVYQVHGLRGPHIDHRIECPAEPLQRLDYIGLPNRRRRIDQITKLHLATDHADRHVADARRGYRLDASIEPFQTEPTEEQAYRLRCKRL